MPDPREVELIQRCQKGSDEAFRELFDRYQRRTYWIAHNMLSNYDVAQDISQEAFLRVFRNIGRFDTRKNFYTWLYQIVVNLCIDHMRRASHNRSTDLDEVGGMPDERRDPSETTGRTELRARVQKGLDRLPPKYKAVLTLRDIQGFNCEEIAEIVGATNATVRWRLHRARKLFRAAWDGKALEAVRDDEGDELV
ncbi:MAG TPA: sigma-70 family RNA polymerase sigma factor [Planctomycetota bacterium]|jgi:RNA polymerase sigma-70 factor (ECF subfamily)